VDATDSFSGDEDAFVAGCQEAKGRLDPIDVRRADPQYRAGFNDEATRLPMNASDVAGSPPAAPQQAAPPDASAPDACFVLSGEERRTVSCAVDLGPGHPATLSHTKISKTECFVFHGGEITCSEMDAAEVASELTSKNLNLDAKWETKVSKTSCNVFSPADHMTITCASLDSTEANLIKMGYCYNPSIPGDGLVQDWHKCLPNEHQPPPHRSRRGSSRRIVSGPAAMILPAGLINASLTKGKYQHQTQSWIPKLSS
jgi:hypothetical protein